ncbi:MAG: L,D-transpeptidase family protein, partial [Candidatus Omnitrophica bacterium]|nr:L,D-transpeptidase family protein [Candidatus Omnitrophota bacterium]
AGCLAFMLFLILVGAGVLFFLQYQKKIQLEERSEYAQQLYLQNDRGEGEPIDELKQAEAIRIWKDEIIPKSRDPKVLEYALFTVAEESIEEDPDLSRTYFQRIVDEFPDSEKAQVARVRLADFNVRSNPEAAKEFYAEVLDSTATGSLQADALLGTLLLEDDPNSTPSPEIRERYQEIIKKYPDTEASAKARKRMNEVNRQLIFVDPNPNEFKKIYEVQRGDVLLRIANEYTTTVYIIEMMNNIRATALRPRQNILVPTWGKVYVVVDKSDYELRIFREEDNSFLLQYPVGIGKMEWRTKEGEYMVSNKAMHPPWPDPETGRILKYEDPEYPLGERWLGLSPPGQPSVRTGLGIHGTNEPDTIGTSSSAGCVRLRNEDVIEAFAIIRQNSRVMIQD